MELNAIIRKAYDDAEKNKDFLGINISDITRVECPRYGSTPCFFLHRELGRTARDLYQTGQYRHAKVYRNGYLDYITKKEFATLEDWVADCDSSMDDVLYGYNKFDGRQSYVLLAELLNHLKPLQVAEVDEVTKFMAKLAVNDLSLSKNILVLRDNKVETFDQFMTE
jgi:hypothetical protein